MLSVLVSVFFYVHVTRTDNILANIATLLPANESSLFSISKIRYAIYIAQDKVQKFNYGDHNVTFNIRFADSQCTAKNGMNQAIQMYMNKTVNVFLGPTCDYSVAAVERQVTFWNIPIISAGAMSLDFEINRLVDYPLLTRAGPADFSMLSRCIGNMFKIMNWNNPLLIYDKDENKGVLEEFCNFCTTSLHYSNRYHYYKLEPKWKPEKVLVEQVGNKYAGKSLNFC